MNLFGCKFCKYIEVKHSKHLEFECSRKNFDSLLWATLTVFQVIHRSFTSTDAHIHFAHASATAVFSVRHCQHLPIYRVAFLYCHRCSFESETFHRAENTHSHEILSKVSLLFVSRYVLCFPCLGFHSSPLPTKAFVFVCLLWFVFFFSIIFH